MTRFTKGKLASSISFNGTNGRLQLVGGGSSSLIPPNFLTVSAWIKTPGPAVGGTAMVIFARDDGSTGRMWNLSVDTAGKVKFTAWKSGPTAGVATGTTVVTDNRWHFVMGTWDGATVTVFVDGASEGTTSLSGTGVNQANNAYPGLGIRTGTSEWYRGLMTHISLYNTAFTLAMHQDAYYNQNYYSQYVMWQFDSKRDLVNANTDIGHDVTNVFTGNTIVAVTRHPDVPHGNDVNYIPVKKILVSSNAKGASIFNTASYADSYLTTYNGNQYIIFNDTSLNVMIGKRAVGSTTWTIVDTGLNTGTNDDHNLAVLGIDKNGYIHIAWDHHGTNLNYAKSNSAEDITAFTTIASMIGDHETQISYPKFFNTATNMFFSYRDGGSLDGDEYLNKYNADTQTWTRVAKLVDGRSYPYGTYPDSYVVDSNGRIHHAFCWRVDDSPAILYEDYTYMYSDDEGVTWYNSQGVQYTLPVDRPQAGDIISGNINIFWPQNHLWVDSQNRPHIGYGKAATRITRENYFHAYLDNGTWQHTQITDFSNTISSLATFGNYKFSRPTTLVDTTTDRVYVIGRVWEGDYLRVITALPPYTQFEMYRLGSPPQGWGRMEMGGVDKRKFAATGILHITADAGYATNPDSLYVLEADLRSYFGAPTRTSAGRRMLVRDFGTSLYFNGSSAKIALAQTSGLPLYANTSWTFSAWVYVGTYGTNVIWGEGNTGAGGQLVEFAVVSDTARQGKFRFQIRNDSAVFQLQDKFSSTKLSPNRWYHVTLVDNNGDVHLYINGTEDANTTNNSWDYTRSTLTINASTIGALTRTTTSNYFNGYIDNVRLFSKALSATEVADLYYDGKSPTTNKVGIYLFDEGSGTTATDSSGNSNTGTITAATYSTQVPMKTRTAA